MAGKGYSTSTSSQLLPGHELVWHLEAGELNCRESLDRLARSCTVLEHTRLNIPAVPDITRGRLRGGWAQPSSTDIQKPVDKFSLEFSARVSPVPSTSFTVGPWKSPLECMRVKKTHGEAVR